MKLSWIPSLVAVTVVTACATHSKHPDGARVSPIAFEHSLRGPAQSAEPSLEERFQNMMAKSESYGKMEMAINLRLLSRGFYRAEVLRGAFDKDLARLVSEVEKNPKANIDPLSRITSYPQLLAIWNIYRKIEGKLEYYHARLLQTAFDDVQTLARAGTPTTEVSAKRKSGELARIILKDFYQTVANYEALDGATISDLAQEIAEQNADYHRALEASGLLPDEKIKLGDLEKVIREKGAGAWGPEQQKAFRKKAESEAKKDDQVGRELKETVPQFRELMKIQPLDPKRLPQQVAGKNIRPGGIGTTGNMVGTEFPKGVWALTYDDGPHATHTFKVLENLKANNIPATFFQLAQSIKTYPKAARAVVEAKVHTLANHSYTHPQIPKQTDPGMKREISQSMADEATDWTAMLDDIKKTDPTEKRTALRAKFFRLPYGDGVKNPKARDMIAAEDMVHVFWNVDTLDWQDKNPESVLKRTLDQMKIQKRGIILFHDVHPQSVEASRMLMEWVNQNKATEGIRMVTLPQIVNELNCPARVADPKAECPADMWRPE